MPISKEEFEKLANDIAHQTDMSYTSIDWSHEWICDFAHALIKAVQEKSEVVGWQEKTDKHTYSRNQTGFLKGYREHGYELIALPLVSEE